MGRIREGVDFLVSVSNERSSELRPTGFSEESEPEKPRSSRKPQKHCHL